MEKLEHHKVKSEESAKTVCRVAAGNLCMWVHTNLQKEGKKTGELERKEKKIFYSITVEQFWRNKYTFKMAGKNEEHDQGKFSNNFI
jgi:hypothetical protein